MINPIPKPTAQHSNIPAVIDVRVDPKVNTVINYLAKRRPTPPAKKKEEIIIEVSHTQ